MHSSIELAAGNILAHLVALVRFDCRLFEALLASMAALLAATRIGRRTAAVVWNTIARLSRKPPAAYAAAFLAGFGLRLCLLPLMPIPQPYVPDEFSHLFLADTLLTGRLANPTHPLWAHFETIHIFYTPTYSSMYVPGQAIFLAAGKLLFGHPWYGVLLSSGLMACALLWAFRAWLPPAWAMFGAVITVLRISTTSYWVNSFWGGCAGATGGALLLGAYAHLRKRIDVASSAAAGGGIVLLMFSRPYEGFVLAALLSVSLAVTILRRQGRPALFRPALAPALLLPLCGLLFLAFYNFRVTGSPTKLGYTVNREIYGWPMTLPWLKPKPAAYRHKELADYYEWELEEHQRITRFPELLVEGAWKADKLAHFFVGLGLFPLLVMLPRVARDHRIRTPLIASAVLWAAVVIEQSSYAHYLAPATAGILLIVIQCMRHVSARARAGRFYGRTFVRLLPLPLAALALVRAAAPVDVNVKPSVRREMSGVAWCCKEQFGRRRAEVTRTLSRMGGSHVVFVRYNRTKYNTFEWVYNAPDIDSAPIVWARDMGQEANRPVLKYFLGRRVWLIEPDASPMRFRELKPSLPTAQ